MIYLSCQGKGPDNKKEQSLFRNGLTYALFFFGYGTKYNGSSKCLAAQQYKIDKNKPEQYITLSE